MLPGNPLVNHVTAIRTALPVPPVVHILPLLVLLEPMPVVQHRVSHVVVANTTINQDKLLVKIAIRGNTKTKWEKHRATTIV